MTSTMVVVGLMSRIHTEFKDILRPWESSRSAVARIASFCYNMILKQVKVISDI